MPIEFDPSKLAPSLAAVGGALAAPGNPQLGAALAGGLAGAIFPSQEERQMREYRDLQMQNARQNLEQGKLSMLATQQAMDLNKAQESRAQAKFGMEQQEAPLRLASLKAQVEGQQLNLSTAKNELAYNFLKAGADGGAKASLEGLSQTIMQATGRPATADDIARWQAHPAAMAITRLQRFIGAVQSMDEINPEQQMAISRYAAEAGLNGKFMDGKLTIADPFGQSDLNKDGTINGEDISMLKQTLQQTVAKEAAYQEMVTGMKNNPVAALAGNAASQMAEAYQRHTDDPNPTEMAAMATDGVATEYGKSQLAAASMIGWFTNNPNDPSLVGYQQAFNSAHQADGMSIVIDEMGGGNHFVQISKGNPWVKKHLGLMKANGQTGAVSEDDYNVRIPVQQYRDYVEKSFKAEIEKAMPKPDPLAEDFRVVSYDSTPVMVRGVDANGNEVMEEKLLGTWAQEQWVNRARAAIAGTNGDQAKLTPKDWDQFRKTEEGKFLMRAIAIEARGLLGAKKAEQATNRAASPAEVRRADMQKAAMSTDLDKSIPALSGISAVQAMQRKEAGGKPSLAMAAVIDRAISEKAADDKSKVSLRNVWSNPATIGK